jgi:hypothetical protein
MDTGVNGCTRCVLPGEVGALAGDMTGEQTPVRSRNQQGCVQQRGFTVSLMQMDTHHCNAGGTRVSQRGWYVH